MGQLVADPALLLRRPLRRGALFEVFNLFIERPWLALIPAAVMAAAWHLTKSRLALAAGLMWLGYAIYEFTILKRWSCGEECNIRVDLLILAPLLWGLTIAGLARAAWRSFKGERR